MQTESARMSSAAEARFRVQAPNSRPRAIKAVALDATGRAVVERLADAGWQHATFFTALSPDALRDLTGLARNIHDEVASADLVVFVAGPGGHADAAPIIGALCSERRVMTTALLVGATSAAEPDVSKTLAQLRPWSLMVVIASSDDYIADMLRALRA
jgi:hypothetical protein